MLPDASCRAFVPVICFAVAQVATVREFSRRASMAWYQRVGRLKPDRRGLCLNYRMPRRL